MKNEDGLYPRFFRQGLQEMADQGGFPRSRFTEKENPTVPLLDSFHKAAQGALVSGEEGKKPRIGRVPERLFGKTVEVGVHEPLVKQRSRPPAFAAERAGRIAFR